MTERNDSFAHLTYPQNLKILRNEEFPNLGGTVYLDHTGSALYTSKQIENYMSDLKTSVYGNPHSGSLSSQITSSIVDQIRCEVLAWFNVTLDDYNLVFCSGATDALKVLCSSFAWTSGAKYVYLEDNHTSVVGIREVAVEHGASCYCVSYQKPPTGSADTSVYNLNDYDLHEVAVSVQDVDGRDSRPINLFAFPAQSNFSGCKYPQRWVEEVKSFGLAHFSAHSTLTETTEDSWMVLLDAAALVPTSPLDLKANGADFVCISFYKMFGFPTGIGALLVRKSAEKCLTSKRYFGGGTANGYLATSNYFNPRKSLHERLEDGSLPFLDIVALKHGFDTLTRICGSIERIQDHTFTLIRRLYDEMRQLRHNNNKPLVEIYSNSDFQSSDHQGAIIAFNLMREDGSYIGFNHVLHMAASCNVHLRSGCFCNVGACISLLGLDSGTLKNVFEGGHTCGDHIDLVDGQPVGAVRVSLGYMSTTSDVDRFVEFLRQCFLQAVPEQGEDIFYDAVTDINGKENRIFLEKIFLYPVKSCRGIEVNKWEICETGLRYDRNWMIVNEHGVCVTLKREPRLTLVQPSITLPVGTLTLSAEGFGSVTVHLEDENPLDCAPTESSVCQTKVCGDRIAGVDCGSEASRWLSEMLGYDVRLLRITPDANRVSKRFHNNTNGKVHHALALANEAQFLMISRSSAEHLRRAMVGDRLAIDDVIGRFRCNFVVSGTEVFVEESWKRLTATLETGECVEFACTGLCNRCSMVCIDHKNGTKTCEPLRTLGTLPPSKHAPSPSTRRKNFGVYLCSAGYTLRLEVGACISVTDEF